MQPGPRLEPADGGRADARRKRLVDRVEAERDHALSAGDREGRGTLERVFEIEIDLPPEGRSEFLGSRMHVRFDHGFEPLGLQAWRALRQLFLRRFGV